MNYFTAPVADDDYTDPHRDVIEALIASARGLDYCPLWVRQPSSPAEFFASLVVHSYDLGWNIELIYDQDDRVTWVKGIAPKNHGRAA